MAACLRGRDDIVGLLLAQPNIDVNKQDESKGYAWSALMTAACSNIKCVQLMLDHRDINVNLKDDMGHTVLKRAIIGKAGDDMINLLRRYGASE